LRFIQPSVCTKRYSPRMGSEQTRL